MTAHKKDQQYCDSQIGLIHLKFKESAKIFNLNHKNNKCNKKLSLLPQLCHVPILKYGKF